MEQRETSIKSKIGYGFADIYGGGSFLIIGILFLVFLTDIVKLEPIVAGTIPLIGRIWDAVTDPIMGMFVDRTRTKYGSKRFYLLIGSFVASITFALMWISIDGSAVAQYFFYLFAFILFSTGFTIVMVPYNALLPDMVTDYNRRGQYTAYRMIFSAISAILAGLIPNKIISLFGDNASLGFLVMGIAFGILFFIAIFITFLGTWEHLKPVKPMLFKDVAKQSISVFKNKSFRMYLGVFLFGQGSADFVTALVIYFLAVVLRQSDQYTFIMSGVLVSQLLAMFLYQFMLKKTSKKMPILVGFPIRIVATLSMFFFAFEGAPILPIFIASFISGLGTAASSVSSFAILSDLTDVDELITTQRRPGTYSGMATFSRKIASGVTLGIIGVLLSVFKYDSDLAVQAPITVLGVKLMFIVLPVIFMIFTLYYTVKFPINRLEFQIMQTEINRRKGQDASVATEAEKIVCEKITGYPYVDLWREENAG